MIVKNDFFINPPPKIIKQKEDFAVRIKSLKNDEKIHQFFSYTRAPPISPNLVINSFLVATPSLERILVM